MAYLLLPLIILAAITGSSEVTLCNGGATAAPVARNLTGRVGYAAGQGGVRTGLTPRRRRRHALPSDVPDARNAESRLAFQRVAARMNRVLHAKAIAKPPHIMAGAGPAESVGFTKNLMLMPQKNVKYAQNHQRDGRAQPHSGNPCAVLPARPSITPASVSTAPFRDQRRGFIGAVGERRGVNYDAQQVIRRGQHVFGRHRLALKATSPAILSDLPTARPPATPPPARTAAAARPVVAAAAVAALELRRPPVFAQQQHERVVEHAAAVEVGDESGESAVEPGAQLVRWPREVLPVRVPGGAGQGQNSSPEDADETRAHIDQPAGRQPRPDRTTSGRRTRHASAGSRPQVEGVSRTLSECSRS